ncbi:MAG: hypothetical protein ACI4LC_06635 [Emergencia sp.]
MRRKIISVLLSVAMVMVMMPSMAFAAGGSSLTDLSDSGNWVTDRTEPQNWKITDGKITFSVSESPAAENWYAYQGKKANTGYPVSGYWCEEHTFEITQEMLETNNVNASLWIQVDKEGSDTVDSQKNCVDWSIIQFINVENAPQWQAWNSNGSGSWGTVDVVTPSVGTHSVKTIFNNGVIRQYIDGAKVNEYTIKDGEVTVTETAPVSVIAQARSYGSSFSVKIGVPVITSDITDLSVADSWVTDRTEPQNWKITDGKITFSVSESPAAENWYAYQGKKANTGYPVSGYWCEEHTFEITQEMLETNNVNASLWIQVDKEGSDTVDSQKNCVDWSIIQFINVENAPQWQAWNSNGSGSWGTVDVVTPSVGTHSVKTV